MALKDWKKFKNGWVIHDSSKHMMPFKKSLFIENKKVIINDNYDSEYSMHIHAFKTKSQALKFAKSYMRTH